MFWNKYCFNVIDLKIWTIAFFKINTVCLAAIYYNFIRFFSLQTFLGFFFRGLQFWSDTVMSIAYDRCICGFRFFFSNYESWMLKYTSYKHFNYEWKSGLQLIFHENGTELWIIIYNKNSLFQIGCHFKKNLSHLLWLFIQIGFDIISYHFNQKT